MYKKSENKNTPASIRRNRVFAILWPEVSFTDFLYRVVSANLIRSMAFHEHPVFLLTRSFLPFPVNQFSPALIDGRVIVVDWRHSLPNTFCRPS